MSNQPTLTPVEPGATPDDAAVQSLLAGNVGDVTEGLVGLTDAQLAQALELERGGKNRSTVLGAITREQSHREVDGDVPPENGDLPNVTGDRETYRDRPATDVDPTKITSPVLTRDGWIVPSPRASAQ